MFDEPARENPRFLEWQKGLAKASPATTDPLATGEGTLRWWIQRASKEDIFTAMDTMATQILHLRYRLATEEARARDLSPIEAHDYVMRRMREGWNND